MTIATGLDAFHAAEGYHQPASPVTDAICENYVFTIKYLQGGEDGRIEARERVMVAATLGGWMLNNEDTCWCSVAHVIGSKYHIPHGMACAYALPGYFNLLHQLEVKK